MEHVDSPILVVSAPRSGSSMVSRLLVSAGVFGGAMKPGDKWNKHGYFENIGINDLVVQYLRHYDTDGLGKRFQPEALNKPWEDFGWRVVLTMREQGLEGHQPWFYKNPKVLLCWRLWNTHFPNAKWLVVRRNRADVIASLMRAPFKSAYDTPEGWETYLDYHEARLCEVESQFNSFSVDVDELFAAPGVEPKLLKWLGIDCPEEIRTKYLDKSLWNGRGNVTRIEGT